ncbi:hypothetical protein [Bacillus mycoides]|uniref:hypothetical protein n=1 Tax=Bacillus mycoides TaxID=1405 RepID=UPI0010BE8BD1|nr:hypothetical protein [Bacillus mycoides]TKI43432.1 hypothetical protein FC700_12255 [Bacillus mycoides]
MVVQSISIQELDDYFKSEQFGEALGIAWRYGSKRHMFSVRHIDKDVVNRYAELVPGNLKVTSNYRKDKDYTQWECNISISHPFFVKMLELGWKPLFEQDRIYPNGDFFEDAFVKSYIRLHHDIGSTRVKDNGDIFVKPRLRIHGSADVLEKIGDLLCKRIGVKKKKIQTDHKIERAKTIHYQSKVEVPKILAFVEATNSLEKYQSFKLGYQKINQI